MEEQKGRKRMILLIGGAYQGKTAYAREYAKEGDEIINHYHKKVREQMEAGLNPLEEAEKLVEESKEAIIISDEVGYGLVPMDAFEREYREMVGRVNCYLAEHAEQVIRIVCGIGTRIK